MKYSFFLRNTITALIMLVFVLPTQAQIGISGFYRSSLDDFKSLDNTDGGAFGSGYELAVDYWFRLPKNRIEFLPTLSYGAYKGSNQIDATVDLLNTVNFDIKEFSFQFKTNIYLFDLAEECDCPKWGKQGPSIKKGLFLQIAPAYSFFSSKSSNENALFDGTAENTQSLFSLSGGIGFDLSLSKMVTLTPVVGYRYYFKEFDWSDSAEVSFLNIPSTRMADISNLHLGLRLGLYL